MKFTTRNSTYEVDLANKRIRRLCGVNEPLQSQGSDGTWRNYDWISGIEVGNYARLEWAEITDKPYMTTSSILAVEPDVTPAKDEACASQQQSPEMMAI